MNVGITTCSNLKHLEQLKCHFLLVCANDMSINRTSMLKDLVCRDEEEEEEYKS